MPITSGKAAWDVKPHAYLDGDREMLLIQFWNPADGANVKPCMAFSCDVSAHARFEETDAVFLLNPARRAEGEAAIADLNQVGYMMQWTRKIEENDFQWDLADVAEHVRRAWAAPSSSSDAGVFGAGVYEGPAGQ